MSPVEPASCTSNRSHTVLEVTCLISACLSVYLLRPSQAPHLFLPKKIPASLNFRAIFLAVATIELGLVSL